MGLEHRHDKDRCCASVDRSQETGHARTGECFASRRRRATLATVSLPMSVMSPTSRLWVRCSMHQGTVDVARAIVAPLSSNGSNYAEVTVTMLAPSQRVCSFYVSLFRGSLAGNESCRRWWLVTQRVGVVSLPWDSTLSFPGNQEQASQVRTEGPSYLLWMSISSRSSTAHGNLCAAGGNKGRQFFNKDCGGLKAEQLPAHDPRSWLGSTAVLVTLALR